MRFLKFLRRRRCPDCGAKVRETYCRICGYDLVERTRAKVAPPRIV